MIYHDEVNQMDINVPDILYDFLIDHKIFDVFMMECREYDDYYIFNYRLNGSVSNWRDVFHSFSWELTRNSEKSWRWYDNEWNKIIDLWNGV